MRVDVGAFAGGTLDGPWGGTERAELDPQATTDGVTSFYFRAARPGATVALPVRAGRPFVVRLRARATVRSAVRLFAGSTPLGEVLAGTGPWTTYELRAAGAERDALELRFAFRPLPLVAGDHAANPALLVDWIEVAADERLGGTPRALVTLAVVPLAVAALAAAGAGSAVAGAVGAAAAAGAVAALGSVAPVPLLVALPRLGPFALATGALAWLLLRRTGDLTARARAALAAVVLLGTAAHGAVAFFPEHAPPDLEIHVRRTLDFREVPLEYGALMRYGSQLPTASQTFGQATAALGERTLIPYSPLPYLAYYAVARAGLDLRWAMTALNAGLAMGAGVALWLCARRLWGDAAAWSALLLYVLDLPVWHHLGRVHAPAVFGGALGVVALSTLAREADRLTEPHRVAALAALLGLAVLGYSSLVVLFGLFGLLLLVFLAADARALARAQRLGLAAALAGGGLLALVLFYGHYVPGMMGGAAGVEAEADPFPGRTYLIFHNESRQSLRLWALGLVWPLLVGLAAVPVALVRSPPAARVVLASWLGAWALVMLLKEPALFPKLLRWAKEDQFLSPLLDLSVGAAVGALPGRALRVAVAAAVVALWLALQVRDFAHHAVSLSL